MSSKNPLVTLGHPPKAHWDLDEFCAASNNFNFVRSSGRPYFISQMMMPDGTVRRYLDRNA